jgi:hypothetical protein
MLPALKSKTDTQGLHAQAALSIGYHLRETKDPTM